MSLLRLGALLTSLLVVPTAHAQGPTGCQNSEDGGPKVEGLAMVCRLSVTTDDDGNILRETRGLVKAVTVSTTLRLSAGKNLLDAFRDGDRTLQFQPTPVAVTLNWNDGNQVAVTFLTAPVLTLSGNGICNSRVSAAKINIQSATSTEVPASLLRPLVNYLNGNADLQSLIQQRLNQLVVRLKPSTLCG